MYYSNEDFENFYVRYKAEGLPRKISIQEYCIRNKVSWNLFDKWYRDTRHRIKEVAVTGRPTGQPEDAETATEQSAEVSAALPQQCAEEPAPTKSAALRIMVDIKMTNGLHVCQKNLSYQRLLALVENLEALC